MLRLVSCSFFGRIEDSIYNCFQDLLTFIWHFSNKDMKLFRKPSLWGCLKLRHVTNQDVLLLMTVRCASSGKIFNFLKMCPIFVGSVHDVCRSDSENIMISTRCIHGFRANLRKKSWIDSPVSMFPFMRHAPPPIFFLIKKREQKHEW